MIVLVAHIGVRKKRKRCKKIAVFKNPQSSLKTEYIKNAFYDTLALASYRKAQICKTTIQKSVASLAFAFFIKTKGQEK